MIKTGSFFKIRTKRVSLEFYCNKEKQCSKKESHFKRHVSFFIMVMFYHNMSYELLVSLQYYNTKLCLKHNFKLIKI